MLTRTAIATAGTVLVVGALAATALSAQDPAASATAKKAPVEVRTVVVHRTVTTVRHLKAKHHRGAAAGRRHAASMAVAPVASSVATPAVAPAAPVTAPREDSQAPDTSATEDQHGAGENETENEQDHGTETETPEVEGSDD